MIQTHMFLHAGIIILLLWGGSLALIASHPEGDSPKLSHAATKSAGATETDVIEKVIDTSIRWALNKDKQALFDSVSNDADFFIYHPDSHSTIIGFAAFKHLVETVFMDERFKATAVNIRNMKIHLSKSSDVAWFSALLDDHGEWAGTPSAWVNTRWTGVLEKRDGSWRIVQMHFSFASDAVEEKQPPKEN